MKALAMIYILLIFSTLVYFIKYYFLENACLGDSVVISLLLGALTTIAAIAVVFGPIAVVYNLF